MVQANITSPHPNVFEIEINNSHNQLIQPIIPDGKPGTACTVEYKGSQIDAVLHWSIKSNLYWISTNSRSPIFKHSISLYKFLTSHQFNLGDIQMQLHNNFRFEIL